MPSQCTEISTFPVNESKHRDFRLRPDHRYAAAWRQSHKPLMAEDEASVMHRMDASEGFESFAAKIHDITSADSATLFSKINRSGQNRDYWDYWVYLAFVCTPNVGCPHGSASLL